MYKMIFIVFAALLSFTSCEKSITAQNETLADSSVSAMATTSAAIRVTVGNGSGYLNINQDNVKNGELVLIKAGKCQGIYISNLSAPDGKQIVIRNEGGAVEVVGGGIGMSNLKNVMLSGSGTTGITNGLP